MPESTYKSSQHALTAFAFGQKSKIILQDGTVLDLPHPDRYSTWNAVDSLSGEKNPGWRDKIRAGGSATTPAFGQKYTVIQQAPYQLYESWVPKPGASSTYKFAESNSFGVLPVGWPTIYGPDSATVTRVRNRVIREFIQRAEAQTSSFESGQDLGELKQTVESLISPVRALRLHVLSYFTKLRKLKKYNFRHKRDTLRAVSATYLEWTFGWKPLAMDIRDGAVGLLSRNLHPEIVPIQHSATESFTADENSGYVTNDGFTLGYRFKTTTIGSFSVRYKGAVRSGSVNGLPRSVAQDLQLDLPHFLPTLWDLLPYSFVVDYFANVGDIIRSACFRYADLSWAQVTTRTFSDSFSVITKSDKDPGALGMMVQRTYATGGRTRLNAQSWSRSPLVSSDLLPNVQFSLPVSGKPWENIGFLILDQLVATRNWLR